MPTHIPLPNNLVGGNMIIYKATNLINGKSYIGKTIYDLKLRIRDHIRYAVEGKSNNYFPNALVHYGTENFKWEVIDECNNEKWLLELEKYYIYYYDTFNNGYNLTIGGDGSSGWNHTEETKELMRKPKSKETRLKMSKANQGLIKPQWVRDKISRSKKGIKIGSRGPRKEKTKNKIKESVTKTHISKTDPKRWERIKKRMSISTTNYYRGLKNGQKKEND